MNKKKPESKAAPAKARPLARRTTARGVGTQPSVNEWQAVWMRAVALSWKDSKFEAALQQDPRQALKERFDFELPAGIHLKVVPPTATEPAAASEWKLASTDVELALPKRPDNVADHAVALSSLTDTSNRSHCCGSPCC